MAKILIVEDDPIVAIPGESRTRLDMLHMAQSLGADHILSKPFDDAGLTAALTFALARQPSPAPAPATAWQPRR